MESPNPRRVARSAAAVLIAAGLVVVGRLSAGAGPAGADAYRAAETDGYHAGYLAGLADGVVEGRQEGRALQVGDTVPPASRQPVQDAFDEGYAAGANDVFTGYDGGWTLAQPYVVTLEPARTPIAYRIGSRTSVQPGVDYFLCANGRDLCQQPRRP
jgi:hypothetical protein